MSEEFVGEVSVTDRQTVQFPDCAFTSLLAHIGTRSPVNVPLDKCGQPISIITISASLRLELSISGVRIIGEELLNTCDILSKLGSDSVHRKSSSDCVYEILISEVLL